MAFNSDDKEHVKKILQSIDTGRYSLIHYIFNFSPFSKFSYLKHTILPYIATCVVTFGVLLLIFTIHRHSNPEGYENITRMLLEDFNVMWMFLITLPLGVTLLVNEKRLIPLSLKRIFAGSVLKMDEGTAEAIKNDWYKKYGKFNIIGQSIGVVVGSLVVYGNYQSFFANNFTEWQFVNNSVTVASYYYLFLLFVFYFIVSVYIIRYATTVRLLNDVVRRSNVNVIPFHPDGCCGLEPVGKLGLQNQYLITVLGINIVILLHQYYSGGGADVAKMSLIVAAIMAYMVASPLIFLGPLIPFREKMIEKKTYFMNKVAYEIKTEFANFSEAIKENEIIDSNSRLYSLKNMSDLIGNIPVWPFDFRTTRKFITAYIIPVISLVATLFGETVFEMILKSISS